MKCVLVTGGTGFIGSNLVAALVNEGCHVRILRRATSDRRALGSLEVEECVGDIRDRSSLVRAIKGCDMVFHTAAMVSYWRKKRSEMMEINVVGMKNVVESCLDLGIEKLVHTSSIAAIGFEPEGKLADESTSFNWEPYDVGYRISKYRGEQEVMKGVRLGLQAVMVNPSVVIGPRDIHFHGGQLIRDVFKKRLFYSASGGMNVVDVDDVVRGHISAARRGRIGERYILGGENLTHHQIVSITSEVVGGLGVWLRLPTWVVQALAAGAETVANLTNTRPWLTRELVAGLDLTVWFSHDKARRELNYHPNSFREAVQKAFDWYRQNGFL